MNENFKNIKGIIFAFSGSWKPSYPVFFSEGGKLFISPCQYFVSIALVPNIEYDLILWHVEAA